MRYVRTGLNAGLHHNPIIAVWQWMVQHDNTRQFPTLPFAGIRDSLHRSWDWGISIKQ